MIIGGRRTAALGAAFAAIVLGATTSCSSPPGGAPPSADRQDRTEATVAVPIAPAPSTTAATSEGGTGDEGVCGERSAIAADAFDAAGDTAMVDLDGDGATDEVVLVAAGPSWTVGVRLADGSTASVELATDPGADVRLLSTIDLEADGRPYVVVVLGGGASTEVIALLRFAECEVQFLADEAGPVLLLTGASAANVSAVSCRIADDTGPAVVEQFDFAAIDGGADEAGYRGSVEALVVDDGRVVSRSSTDGARLSASEVAAIELIDCGNPT